MLTWDIGIARTPDAGIGNSDDVLTVMMYYESGWDQLKRAVLFSSWLLWYIVKGSKV